ncbi:urease subunit beta [Yersinia kristensenii]|uniref:urease subunit beta n=1 Tax=Yersinia kristensenii TaxID=28152 RepID=UPI000518C87A|nr:urease subunit beta [Yersinia kristensenii]MBW5827187.1 urease subunit beta [Yersinia kristensenii]MDA5488718.1 urease subunit beta [Yersinia kristensenii]OWF84449.1 urease subunit beta [Yersinia kristensenii]PEH53490.1 urease subunit beta [Yersinia kristensenii]SUP67255.1 urease subunit beta [Yersinia kristensenii]
MSTKTNTTKASTAKTTSTKTNRGTKSSTAYSEQNTPLGGCILADTPITFNENKPVTKVKVRNTGDRPIQIGSHFHFFEVNRALEFDRAAAYGKRLNISSTTAIRFEPGDETEVPLIPFGGKQTLYGFNNLVDGWTGEGVVPNSERPDKLEAIRRAAERGFKSSK